jgi:hypothetical protein
MGGGGAAAPTATLGSSFRTAPWRLENFLYSAAERRWCWRKTSDNTQQDREYRNKREELDNNAVAQTQGDLCRPTTVLLFTRTKGRMRQRWRVCVALAGRSLTRATVALERHTSVVFVSSVLRSHVKALPPALPNTPRNLRAAARS